MGYITIDLSDKPIARPNGAEKVESEKPKKPRSRRAKTETN